MAQAVKPTNDEIVRLLDRILRELADLSARQRELSSTVDEIAKTIS